MTTHGNTFTSPTNTNNDNLHQPHSVSFHRFPKKKILKRKKKLVKAKGNLDCVGSSDENTGFNQMDNLNDHTDELMDTDALPTLSSLNVEASKQKVCRFCLATNVKMFSLQAGVLKTCLETIVGLHENHDVNGLPQYLCYICAAYLLKLYNVIEKSMIAQATLLEIYAENLKITENIVFEQNREKLNLAHTLQSHKTTPCTVYNYVYDDELHVSVLVTDKSQYDKGEDDKSIKDKSTGDISDSESKLTTESLKNLCRILRKDIDESEDLLAEIFDESFDVDENSSGTYSASDNSKLIKSNTQSKLKFLDKRDKNMTTKTNKTNTNSTTEEYVMLDSSDSDFAENDPLLSPTANRPVRRCAKRKIEVEPSRVTKDKCEKFTVQSMSTNILPSPSRSNQLHHILGTVSQKTAAVSDKVPSVEVEYECPICDSICKSTASLNEHILNVHQRPQFNELEDNGFIDTPNLEIEKANIKTQGMEIDNYVGIKKKQIIRIKDNSETEMCSEKRKLCDSVEMSETENRDIHEKIESYEDEGLISVSYIKNTKKDKKI